MRPSLVHVAYEYAESANENGGRERDQLVCPPWLACFQLELVLDRDEGRASFFARRWVEPTAIDIFLFWSAKTIKSSAEGRFCREPFPVCKINKRIRTANVACLQSFDIFRGERLSN